MSKPAAADRGLCPRDARLRNTFLEVAAIRMIKEPATVAIEVNASKTAGLTKISSYFQFSKEFQTHEFTLTDLISPTLHTHVDHDLQITNVYGVLLV